MSGFLKGMENEARKSAISIMDYRELILALLLFFSAVAKLKNIKLSLLITVAVVCKLHHRFPTKVHLNPSCSSLWTRSRESLSFLYCILWVLHQAPSFTLPLQFCGTLQSPWVSA